MTVSGSGDGRQARWRQHNRERRQRIIQAAIEVIEESGPGAEVHVHQIAERAGLSRSVLYRHFEDRADLDRAVQEAVVADIASRLIPSMNLQGTGPEIVERIVRTYVAWAAAHPALHRAADHETDDLSGPLERGLEEIASHVATVIGAAILALGAEPTDEEAATLDPLVYGLVGAVFGSVRRWLNRPERVLSEEGLTRLVSNSVWYVIAGHAAEMGINLGPDQRLDELAAMAGLGGLIAPA
jgi:AcrR family transcriptional regulator